MLRSVTVRSVLALLALALGCVSNVPQGSCPAGQISVCRAVGDCHCGPPCVLGSRCPSGIAGTPMCLELSDSPGMGVCVDVSWATGAPVGMIRCGAELCTAATPCVDWGPGGIHCAPACTSNTMCRSGCCATVSDRDTMRTSTVCAPNAGFRCLPGMAAGTQCEPACESGETCIASSAGPRCAAPCSTDADCAGGCCLAITGGGRACAAVRADCTRGPLTPACSNLDPCVTVTYAARGDHCGGSADSVEVRVRNDCTRAADVEICYERRDGTCECGLHRNVAPGAMGTPAFWACDLTGNFRVSSRAAGDAEGCHPHTCN